MKGMSKHLNKKIKEMSRSEEVCSLCLTLECIQSQESISESESFESVEELPSKETIGDFCRIPNEMIALILTKTSLIDLSNLSLTNKWFRDFILQNFIDSKMGLISLLGQSLNGKHIETEEQQKQRSKLFYRLGLVLKRVSCLLPTNQRIQIMGSLIYRLDAIPRICPNPVDNLYMRFVFECYGQLIKHLVSGWDNSEFKYVFKTLSEMTKMQENIEIVKKYPIGARNSYEYFIRCFYRCIFIDPNGPLPSKDKETDDDRLYLLNLILRKRSHKTSARLLLIMFGPIVTQKENQTTSIPYVSYWDLTDTFLIENPGLVQLGATLRILYSHYISGDRNEFLSILEEVIKTPTNWLPENIASLLYYCGDQITSQYLSSKLERGEITEVAEKLVFLTLVTYKLTEQTKNVCLLIIELAKEQNNPRHLIQEIKVAFCEATIDVENAIELEEDRDVTEVHELVEANNDLLMNFMGFQLENNEEMAPQNEE